MPFELQAGLVAALRPATEGLISLDPHLPLTSETLPRWRTVLPSVDVLFASEDELGDVAEAPGTVVERLAGGRLSLIVLKRGQRGGVACDLRELPARFIEWPPMAVRVVDPTGAGDAFAAGVLAGLLRGDPLPRALGRGAVTASFAVEDWGCTGLLHATAEQADGRLREWFGR
jgi:sugar/nucleoside kinase (ribokinase family)